MKYDQKEKIANAIALRLNRSQDSFPTRNVDVARHLANAIEAFTAKSMFEEADDMDLEEACSFLAAALEESGISKLGPVFDADRHDDGTRADAEEVGRL